MTGRGIGRERVEGPRGSAAPMRRASSGPPNSAMSAPAASAFSLPATTTAFTAASAASSRGGVRERGEQRGGQRVERRAVQAEQGDAVVAPLDENERVRRLRHARRLVARAIAGEQLRCRRVRVDRRVPRRAATSASNASPRHRSSARAARRASTIARNSSRSRSSRRDARAGRRSSRCARWPATAAQSSSIPVPSVATVSTIGGVQSRCAGQLEHLHAGRAPCSSAPGRSALLTTNTSAISSRPAFARLHAVAPARVHDDDRRVGGVGDLDLDLPDADGLDDHPRLAGGVEHTHGLRRREREAAEMPAGRHRADEHARVGRVVLHAHAVAEDRAAGERARRVDREHADLVAVGADARDEPVGSVDLPAPGRAGDADGVGAARCAGRAAPTAAVAAARRRSRRARSGGRSRPGRRAQRAVDQRVDVVDRPSRSEPGPAGRPRLGVGSVVGLDGGDCRARGP